MGALPFEFDRVKLLATAFSINDFTLPTVAVDGYRTLDAAGGVDGQTVMYKAESADKQRWELGEGEWTAATKKLTRRKIFASSNGGAKTVFQEAPFVSIDIQSAAIAGIKTFEKIAGVQAAQISTAVQFVRTAGYYAAGDGGGALYKRVGAGPATVWRFQSADGAWWELSDPYENVLQYGAVRGQNCDAAIQANIDRYADAATIRLPQGVFFVSASILGGTQARLTIEGAGRTDTFLILRNAVNDSIFKWGDGATFIQKIHFRDLWFDGNSANNTAGSGIVFTSVEFPTVEDCVFFNFAENGIQFAGTASLACAWPTVRRCIIDTCGDDCVSFEPFSSGGSLLDSILRNGGQAGFHARGGEEHIVSDTAFDENKLGIWLENTSRINVVGNRFLKQQQHAIYVSKSGSIGDAIAITGNQICDSGLAANNTYCGILLENAINVTVTGNQISQITNTLLAGIKETGTADKNVFDGNGIDGATTRIVTVGANTRRGLDTLDISSTVQPFDADLSALAALSGTNTIYYRSGVNTWSAVTIGSMLSFSGGTLNVGSALNNVSLGATTPSTVKATTLEITSPGTPVHGFVVPSTNLVDIMARSLTAARFQSRASAINFLMFVSSETGVPAFFQAQGGDTDVSISFNAKGAGSHTFSTAGSSFSNQFQISHTASSVNLLNATGGAAGAAPVLSALGNDTDIDIVLSPKGVGVLKMGTSGCFASNGAVATSLGSVGPVGSHTTVQKWLKIKDSGGTALYIPCF